MRKRAAGVDLEGRRAEAGGVCFSVPRLIQLLLLALAMFATVFASNAIGPLQETISRSLRLSDNQIAFLQGPAPWLPVVVGGIPLGMLADRFCRVRLLLIYATLTIIASLGTAYATSFLLLLIARSVIGLLVNATWIAVMSLLSDLYPSERRGRAVTGISFGEFGGRAIAFAVGGVLLVALGPDADSWRRTILWMTVPLVPLMLLLFALRDPPRHDVLNKSLSVRGDFAALWDLRAVVGVLVLGRIMLCIADGAAVIWAAPMFARTYGLPADRIGAMMGTILVLTGVLGAVGAGILADVCQRFGGPRQTVTCLGIVALVSAPAALFPLAFHSMQSAAMLFLFLMCGSVIGVTTATVATVVIPNELRGLSIAVVQSCMCLLGAAPAPLAVSLLTGVLGGPQMLSKSLAIVGVISSALGALMLFIGRRHFPSQGKDNFSKEGQDRERLT
jgi:MFS family permease